MTKATELKLNLSGRIVVNDVTNPGNPVVLADVSNAVHAGNMAKHLAFALAGNPDHSIYAMLFGYSPGSFEHRSANVGNSYSGTDSVNGVRFGAVVARSETPANSVLAVRTEGNYADIVTTCTIPANKPDGAPLTSYNEIGILAQDPEPGDSGLEQNVQSGGATIKVPRGILLVHKIFENDIQKLARSVHEVVHTLRIRV